MCAVKSFNRIPLDGATNFQLVHLKFGLDEKLGFDVAIFTPTNGGPFPTIINPSFFMTTGVKFTNGLAAQAGELNTNSRIPSTRGWQGSCPEVHQPKTGVAACSGASKFFKTFVIKQLTKSIEYG
jgi:hypothetical protein